MKPEEKEEFKNISEAQGEEIKQNIKETVWGGNKKISAENGRVKIVNKSFITKNRTNEK